MAPGRRRGAKGVKSTDELSLGDLVLAKVKGFPAWPAKISRPEDWEKTPDLKKYFVYFFGTSEIAFVAPADIQAFTVEAKIKLSSRCKGKPLRFTQAVKEICEEFEKLQHKKLNGSEDDTSRDVLGSEDCSIDADEDDDNDDDAMKGDMKEGNSLVKPHQKMGTKILDGSISPLGHCSQRRGIIDGKEGKPCASGNVSSSVSPVIYGKQGICKTEGPISLKKETVSTSSSSSDYLSKEENSRSMKVEADTASVEEQNAAYHTKKEGDISPSFQLTYVRHAGSEHKELIKGNEISQLMETKKSAQDVAPFSERKAKKFMEGKHSDIRKNAETEYKDINKAELSRKKINVQQGQLKQTSRKIEVSHTDKKSNSSDITDATAKASTQTNKRVDSNSLKDGRTSLWKGKTENHSNIGVVEFLEKDEDDFPPSKRLCRAVDITEERVRKNTAASKVESSSVDNVKSPFSVGTKRRAVRLCEDEEEEKPKTPVHAGSLKVSRAIDTSKNGALRGKSTPVQILKKTLRVEDGSVAEFSSVERPVEDASPNSQKNLEKKLRKTGGKSDLLSPKKLVLEKAFINNGEMAFSSPKVSPEFVATSRPIPGVEKPSREDITKPTHCNSHKKPPTSQDMVSGVGESSSKSLRKHMGERSKHNLICERKKPTPKSSSHGTDVLEFGGLSGNGSIPGERVELSRTDKIISLDDSKISEPVTSMKHLIAAAQAKKREAHQQNLGSNMFFPLATHAEAVRSSPSSISPILPAGFSNILQPDAPGLQAHSVSPSLASDVQQLSTTIQHDTEQCEEKKIESGNWVTESSLSGGTEAAIARDAFEGMIETLSRTKESIGRATRLAIDCAKYGIASEVIELLIRKLQSENTMHRKVDLFFLVDSITQCSHNHKGIAGASYIPIVQAALSRLLGAAAPPGAAACENRRQCLKVLRLWQDRQILPEVFLKPFMDEVGVTKDETSSGLSLRRPSRVQRAFDDPIRQMEGMFVDEYGSNATFQLAGFLSAHQFDGNDDGDDDEIMPTIFYKEVSERCPSVDTPVSTDAENQSVTPNERRHCILEDVDGELEMEDVSVPLKDEIEEVSVSFKDQMEDVPSPLKDGRHLYVCATTEVAASDICLEMSLNTSELPPLPEGSPPLPPNSPPQTPPLPSSPPPRPAQLPPAVPLPPSFSLQENPFPLPPVGSPSGLLSQQPLLAQPSSAPQCFQPFPPLSSSPSVYQRQPSTNETSLSANGNQLTQVAAAQGLHGNLPGRNDVYGQFRFVPSEAGNPLEPSLCNASRPMEYSQLDAYGNPRSSQSSQQFQLPFTQTPVLPSAATQNQLNHLGYGITTAQLLYPQHPSSHSFQLPNLLDAPKLFVADDQWRPTPVEFNNDHQSNTWMVGGRSSLIAPFAHEGFSRPHPGRLPSSTFSYQPPRHSTLPPPPGSSSSGHVMSGQVEVHAHTWRPT